MGVTLLSRVGGLVRDVLVGRMFGDTVVNSAFAAAFQLPNMFRRLFGEGALSAAFIPAYTDACKADNVHGGHVEGGSQAGQLASLTLYVMALTTSALTVVIELILLAVLLLAPFDAERVLSLRLIMVMLPFMPLICCAAIFAGMLQVHGRFGAASSGPLVLNTFIIATGAWCLWQGPAAEGTAYLIGVATVLSGVTQCIYFYRLLRPHVRFTRAFREAMPRARVMFKKFVPVAIGLGTLQLNATLDMFIAMYPVWVGPTLWGLTYPLDDASNGILSQSQRLYQFPLGVFGVAVATAIFPLLSRLADQPASFVDALRRGIRLSLFIGLPASVGLVLVRSDLTSVLFEKFASGSGFSTEGTERAAMVVLGFAPGVWAYSLNHVLARTFYARGDTSTPMRVGLAAMAVNIALNVGLIWPFKEAGLAMSTSAAAVVQCVVLFVLVRKQLAADGQHVVDGVTLAGVLRIVAAAAVMGGAVWTMLWLWERPATFSGRLLRLGSASALGVAMYGGCALVLRMKEVRWLLDRQKAGNSGGTAEPVVE